MKLDDIGFYTLSDKRALTVARSLYKFELPIIRCEIVITNKCNFNCPYCRGIDCEHMNFEEIRNIILTLGEIKNIRFSGGEPTLNKWLIHAIDFAKLCGVERIAVSTNGSADFDYYKWLVYAGVNDFSISLDACCASDGDIMAGGIKDSWVKVIDNIKKLSEITYVTVGIVVTEDNVDKVNDVIAFADSLGVSDIRVIPSAQYNIFLRALASIDPKYYKKRPILKYRVENTKEFGHVRGLLEGDTRKCPLVLDDIAVMNDSHYPCIIYMREKGDPIGVISDNRVREERLDWYKNHDTHLDPICKKNCLDVCIEYNNRCEDYGVHHV